MTTRSLPVYLVFIILTMYFPVRSQEKYEPGYIVHVDGDTVQGYISYRNWDQNPTRIYFKETLSGTTIRFAPADIRGFSVLNEIYESGIVQVEASPITTSELEFKSELQLYTDTTFLMTMVSGIKNLYYLNIDGKEQFYISTGHAFELLIYKKYLKDVNGEFMIMENNRFRGQLTVYFQDCPTLKEKIDQVIYSKKSLENLFLFYYKCRGESPGYLKKTEKKAVELGIWAGMTLSSLTFASNYYDYLVEADYPTSYNATAGIFFNLFLSKNEGRWALCNDLLFTNYNMEGRYEEFVNENNYIIIDTEIGFAYLKLNNMIRFKYPVSGAFLYVSAGISNGLAVHSTNYYRKESMFYSQYSVEESLAVGDAKVHELGFLLSLGSRYKRFSAEVRYEKSSGMSTYMTLSSPVSRFYFMVGYRF